MKAIYSDELNKLINNGRQDIINLIQHCGENSEFSSKKVLKVTNAMYHFSLSGGRVLSEIDTNNLIDESGYQYNYNVLPTELLVEVFDYLIKKYSE